MRKYLLLIASILFLSLGPSSPAQAQKKKQGTSIKKDVKFLDDISIQPVSNQNSSDPKAIFSHSIFKDEKKVVPISASGPAIENASELQLKYALLLDVEVEQANSLGIFKALDEWMG